MIRAQVNQPTFTVIEVEGKLERIVMKLKR